MSANGTSRSVFEVEGMTCEHCRASVTEALAELPGVEAVEVDLASGRVEVDHSTEFAASSVPTAVEEVGYRIRA
ncbi:MAG: heavy-metal-associated domain-containing protein [Microbacterium sp.]|uniref:heavy-metal-associated domain-containing protein n=1 Tax=Microbacterium sp. TaxID=51671 RepID=UPI0009277C0B|nr:cation transporter [Microbacterium sp.]MBN9172649.1 heavy-metal-associated domain-containing protein [Microbacterium sp.]MBN9188466.1 heavy-metal-associated domain-containing protein [Microbacterium sp.]MBN9194082.1 heavy-metal-associated domain-containing protein [Microbacterium sp.]OJU59887.1 MAG: hypothetical protein BGO04_03540 [Microbacterium sp. 70-38]